LTSSQKPRAGRVLMIVENLPVPRDRRVWQEAQAFNDAGFTVSVICPKGEGDMSAGYENVGGIAVYRHWLPLEARGKLAYPLEYAAALFWQSVLAWRIFFTRGIDVIHAANPPDLIFLVAAQFKPLGVKFLFDHHDLTPELFAEKFGGKGLGYKAMALCERLTFKLANAVISTNESYKQIAVERGGKRPEDVFIVRSGPDLRKFKLTDPDPAIRAKAKYIVGYVGIMGSQDDIDDLLRIIDLYVHKLGHRDTHFLLIGDGTERKPMEVMAAELKIDSYITFTGYVGGEALNQALSSIDIGVCPDECNDFTTKCTTNKVMEYMAMKKALVQFDLVEGRRTAEEAAVYARNGDFLDFAEKIRALLLDNATREEKGAFGYKRLYEHLQWSKQLPQLHAAYRALGLSPKA
jgi:glycosyltransferase involved in cell wall biosynthesis